MERRLARVAGRSAVSGATKGAMFSNALSGSPVPQPSKKSKERKSSSSIGQRAGATVGKVADTKARVTDKAQQVKESIKDMPTTARYAVHSTKEKAKENVADFKRGIVETKESRQDGRKQKASQRRANIAKKRMELQKAQEEKRNGSAKQREATHSKERPVPQPEKPAKKAQDKQRPVTATKPQTERKERPIQQSKETAINKSVKVARQSPAITKDVPTSQNDKKQRTNRKTGNRQKGRKK